MNTKELLTKTLRENSTAYTDFLKGLIACDTQVIGHGIDGGNEINGQRYLEHTLEEMGAAIRFEPLQEEGIQKAMDLYGEGNLNHSYANHRGNLYGAFSGRAGTTLLFNGHVDTMPTGDLSLWRYPPFSPVILDGKLYGLGASDMKGGLAASIMAVRLLQDAGIALPCNVTIMSVADEEGGGNGSIMGAVRGLKADAAVVCEPTNGALYTSSMGFVFMEVTVKGVSLHSAEKWKGVSAIEKAIGLIAALERLERQWVMENKHPHLPPPTLNIGVIQGGVAGSVVAGACTFKLCAHYHPGTMSHSQALKDMSECLETASDGDAWLRENRPVYRVYQAGHAFEVPCEEPIVTAVRHCYRELLGREPVVSGASYGADARVLYNIAGIPTVIMGPGNIDVCHAPNEFIELEQYLQCILLYARLILRWAELWEREGQYNV